MTPEEKKEKQAGIARAAERWKKREAERTRKREERAALRSWLNSVKGVKYFHLRQHKELMKVRSMEDGKIYMEMATPSCGGICVAMTWHANTLSLSVSVCARDDVYDKLEARKYAVRRLMTAEDDDPLGRIVIRFVGGGMKLDDFTDRMVELVSENAVALLGKRVDREWFDQHVL